MPVFTTDNIQQFPINTMGLQFLPRVKSASGSVISIDPNAPISPGRSSAGYAALSHPMADSERQSDDLD